MGRSKRSTSRRAKRAERWLGTNESARSRRWAYEELLLGSNGYGQAREKIGAVATVSGRLRAVAGFSFTARV